MIRARAAEARKLIAHNVHESCGQDAEADAANLCQRVGCSHEICESRTQPILSAPAAKLDASMIGIVHTPPMEYDEP